MSKAIIKDRADDALEAYKGKWANLRFSKRGAFLSGPSRQDSKEEAFSANLRWEHRLASREGWVMETITGAHLFRSSEYKFSIQVPVKGGE